MINSKKTKTNCAFCSELENFNASTLYPLLQGKISSRIIVQNNTFVALAGLGALTEGYVLLLPKKHYLDLSNLPLSEMKAFIYFKDYVVSIMQEIYGPLFCFEHGAANNGNLGGSSVDHAHLHIIPCKNALHEHINSNFKKNSIASLQELRKFSILGSPPYLFVETQDKEKLVYEISGKIKSQYLRILWAASIDMEDKWDWRIYKGLENIISTVKTLKLAFNDVSPGSKIHKVS